MADEEKNEQTEASPEEQQPEEVAAEETPAAEPQVEEAPAEETQGEAEETPPEDTAGEAEEAGGMDEDLPWKDRRRLERSRRPSEAKPQRSPEQRQAEREEARRARAVSRRRYRQAKRAKRGEPGVGTPPAERRPNPVKVRQGVVVSDKANKTITVRIDSARRHPSYEKVMHRSRTLHAHDEQNEAGEGDVVRVIETRRLSRSKRWRLLEVLEKAQ
jgi:small subunit ribosomal protein S17